jgi:modulator of FtsH protease HflK
MQQVLGQNRKVIAGRDNNILYLPLDGAPAGNAAAAPALPPVKAVTEPVESRPARDTRPERGEGR